MITLISIVGFLLLVAICAIVHSTYQARFETSILQTGGAVLVYIGAATSVAVVWGMWDMVGLPIDVLHRALTFQAEDWISGLAWVSLALLGAGWIVNVKRSTATWGTLATAVQALIGATFVIIMIFILAIFLNKKKK